MREYLVTPGEMQAYDSYTIQQIGIPAPVLMERAALALRDEVRLLFPGPAGDGRGRGGAGAPGRLPDGPGRALIAAGGGNNGADGLALARLLSQDGWQVEAVLPGSPEKRTPEWIRQEWILEHYPVSVRPAAQFLADRERRNPSGEGDRDGYALIVDALFGVGLSRPVEGEYARMIEALNRMEGFKLAVDIPSGVEGEWGAVLGTAFRADLTVTFAFAKRGLFIFPGAEFAGQVRVKDIGIGPESFQGAEPQMFTLRGPVEEYLPRRRRDGNKGTFGKVLLAAGFEQMPGAAVLAARAAYCAGAGMVRVLCPGENRGVLQAAVPEALWGDPGEVRRALEWADAAAVGPGLGTSKDAWEVLKGLLEARIPLVVDADAVNLLAARGWPESAQRKGRALVMTPHVGELSRLSGVPVPEIKADPVSVARRMAKENDCVMVCKDARTLICRGEGPMCLNLAGNSGMATAGSGDVLTGLTAGLLAQGMEAFEAACAGVYLHALAGDLAAERFSEYAVTAGALVRCAARLLETPGEREGEQP